MFRVMLLSHWNWSKIFLTAAVVGAFALPVLSVQEAGTQDPSRWGLWELLRSVQSWSVWYAALAAGLGLILGTSAWASDHRGGHVYALSLPIERWRYVLMRFSVGVVLLMVPVLALWIGALVASASIELPEGLRAYPTALAGRFCLASLIAYSVFFAISSGTARTAGYVLVVIGGLVAAQILLSTAGVHASPLIGLMHWLTSWPGPFEVFTGRWMLIDV
jgi:hypothetical protein